MLDRKTMRWFNALFKNIDKKIKILITRFSGFFYALVSTISGGKMSLNVLPLPFSDLTSTLIL